MNKNRKYFVVQKLMGLGIIVLTALATWIGDGDATAAVFLMPIGFYLIFTKQRCICND